MSNETKNEEGQDQAPAADKEELLAAESETKVTHGWPWNEKVEVSAQCKWDGKSYRESVPLAPVVRSGRSIIYYPKRTTEYPKPSPKEMLEASLRGLVNGLAMAAGDPPPYPVPPRPNVPSPAEIFAKLKKDWEQLSAGRVVVVGTKQEYLQHLGTVVGYCPACCREQERALRRQSYRRGKQQLDSWLKVQHPEVRLPSMYDGIYPLDPKTGKYVRSIKVMPIGQVHGPLSLNPETGEYENTGSVYADDEHVGYSRPLTNDEVERFFDSVGTYSWSDSGELLVREVEEDDPELLDRIVEGFVLMSPSDLGRRLGINRMTILRLQNKLMDARPELVKALQTLGSDLDEYRRERVTDLLKLIAAMKSLKN